MEGGAQIMLENGLDYCDCPKTHCVRFANCEECIVYHENKNGLAFCKREKKESTPQIAEDGK